MNKYLEHIKEASFLTSAFTAAKNFGKGVGSDFGKIKEQTKNIGTAYNANKGLLNKGTISTVKALASNKAVQLGAGALSTGIIANKAMNKQSAATNMDAAKTVVKAKVRSSAEGTLGGIGGAALGVGAGLLALKNKRLAKGIIRATRDMAKSDGGATKELAKAIGTKPRKLIAGTLGGALGFAAGGTAGAVHGSLASTKKSLNAQREKKASENKYLDKVASKWIQNTGIDKPGS